jgi:hypothetical protein
VNVVDTSTNLGDQCSAQCSVRCFGLFENVLARPRGEQGIFDVAGAQERIDVIALFWGKSQVGHRVGFRSREQRWWGSHRRLLPSIRNHAVSLDSERASVPSMCSSAKPQATGVLAVQALLTYGSDVAHNPDSAPPDTSDSPAQRLVHLLEQHGLEDSLRNILASLEANRVGEQAGARQRLLDEFLLDGQEPLTQDELEAARREWQG